MHAVLAIGNGEVVVLSLAFEHSDVQVTELARHQMCDIKLLSCYVARATESSFDVLASNGRAELIKATFNTNSGAFEPR